jgi:hypothetical protein
MAKKWIINNNKLILGDVELHKDLISKNNDINKTLGGGYWYYNKDTNIIYFWGESFDFGQVTKKEFENSQKRLNIKNLTIIFSYKKMF